MWRQSASGSDCDEERLSFPLRNWFARVCLLLVAVVAVLIFVLLDDLLASHRTLHYHGGRRAGQGRTPDTSRVRQRTPAPDRPLILDDER